MTRADILPDQVRIFGQVLWRPPQVSPSQWITFWEEVNKGSYEEGYENGYDEGQRESTGDFS